MVTSTAALLVVIALLAVPRNGPQSPADSVPPGPTLPAPEPTLADIDAVDAQLCLTRRNARLLLSDPSYGRDDSQQLAGFSSNRGRLAALTPPAAVWTELADHPDVDPDEAAALGGLLVTFREAQVLSISGENATEGDGFEATLEAFEAAVGSYLAAHDDPSICQSNALVVRGDTAVTTEGRCVAEARLVDSLERLAGTGRSDDEEVVTATSTAWLSWHDRPSAGVLAVAAAVDDLTSGVESDSASPLALLRELSAENDSCRHDQQLATDNNSAQGD